MRKDKCGPSYMPAWLRSMLSKKFNPSCAIHDRDYAQGKISRKEADDKFLRNSLRLAGDSKYDRIIARVFYLGVRVLGVFSYKRTKNGK